jgi:acetyl esterase/lipase
VPYSQKLRDPLLSPFFAPREHLPKKVFIVAAELDRLAHEAWRMASVLAHRPEPSPDTKVGQKDPGTTGKLILDDERFAFEHIDGNGEEVQWLLIPDQIHGFDLEPVGFHGSEKAFQDAQVKTEAYQKILGNWLHRSSWS